MSQQAILRALGVRPMTNLELRAAANDCGSYIARTCSALIHQGRVKRIDGRTGRGAGKEATYALA